MKKTSKKTTTRSTPTAAKKAAKGSTNPASKKNSKEMNTQLRKKCAVIKGLLVTSDTDTLKARCEIGRHVVEAMGDKKKYGNNVLRKLAVALDRDADSLYDYAAVATLLTREEFKGLSRKRSDDHGLPLSFSHWVVIADACERARKDGDDKDAKKADAEAVKKGEDLATKALEKGWSVRKLRSEAEPKSTANLDSVTRLSTALTSTKSKLDENIDAVVAELSTDDVSAERLGDGRKLVGLLRVVRDAAANGIEKLQQALESVSPTPEMAPSSSPAASDSERRLTGRDTSTPAIEAMHAS